MIEVQTATATYPAIYDATGSIKVRAAIQSAIELCRKSPEHVTDLVVSELSRLDGLVAETWPLAPETKQQIYLGPFAVKNIADWNPQLSNALTDLDYALRHDGQTTNEKSPGE